MPDEGGFDSKHLVTGGLVWVVGAYTWYETRTAFRVPVVRDVLGLALGIVVGGGVGGLSVAAYSLWRIAWQRPAGQSVWEAIEKAVGLGQGDDERKELGRPEAAVVAITLMIGIGSVWYETRKIFRVPIVRDIFGLVNGLVVVGYVALALRRFLPQ